jgi:hypothetical protein
MPNFFDAQNWGVARVQPDEVPRPRLDSELVPGDQDLVMFGRQLASKIALNIQTRAMAVWFDGQVCAFFPAKKIVFMCNKRKKIIKNFY